MGRKTVYADFEVVYSLLTGDAKIDFSNHERRIAFEKSINEDAEECEIEYGKGNKKALYDFVKKYPEYYLTQPFVIKTINNIYSRFFQTNSKAKRNKLKSELKKIFLSPIDQRGGARQKIPKREEFLNYYKKQYDYIKPIYNDIKSAEIDDESVLAEYLHDEYKISQREIERILKFRHNPTKYSDEKARIKFKLSISTIYALKNYYEGDAFKA